MNTLNSLSKNSGAKHHLLPDSQEEVYKPRVSREERDALF
jgi:hypothetical protein